ncbi:hypothetical protein A2Y99_01275 [Candidatus Gottesmanbacteria bacterium RBG_13_37_7]|uniref:Glycosyltransferase subfamily 4-like N-terminal domain-containing protein n=1 Tax=Candidatus Gottesmanbacteria bacterium RBG_13_37_7 TaxID=1798369 RepID=A0A1F5YH48_9BACT|nr:MAG: hypothetical protein A2Y99_01275 [Candidatus Gottesmanbacteria bacterium RBG_13_37_7]
MKIVHLIDYFQPKIGYQETFLSRGHQKLGYNVSVVTSNYYYPFPDYENTYGKVLGDRKLTPGQKIEEGINIVRLSSFEITGTPLIFLSGLENIFKHELPDLVICHGVFSLTSFRIAGIKKKYGFKLIYDTHAAHFNTDFSSTFSKRFYISLFRKFAVAKILKARDSVFAIGEDERDLLCEEFGLDKSAVPIIRLGVDTSLFKYSLNKRKETRKKLGIKDKEILIISTGKISSNKDIHILVEAINRLKDEKIKILLIGGGDKGYIDDLKVKTWNRNSLIIIPFMENRFLSGYYSASDLAVWSGDSTIAIQEALATGLSVILPKYYGNMFLDDSKGVIRFKRGDTSDLSEKIRNLAYNKALRKKCGRKGKFFTQSNLSWEKISHKVLDLLD